MDDLLEPDLEVGPGRDILEPAVGDGRPDNYHPLSDVLGWLTPAEKVLRLYAAENYTKDHTLANWADLVVGM